MLYKGEECSGNEHAQGTPLDLRNPILISPTGTPEKEMANHCGILAWRISWTEETGRLQSMGSQRVRDDLVTKQHYHLFTELTLKRVQNVYSVLNTQLFAVSLLLEDQKLWVEAQVI